MIELRPILLINGILLATLGSAMMVPAFFDLIVGDDDWMIFVASAGITLFAGGALAFANRGMAPSELSTRQAFLLTTSAWLLITAFSSLPFIWSTLRMSPADAFFEAMSGVTTTGATVITNLDHGTPPGILVWRALLQWLGGIGIIVVAIAVLPMLRIGGMQLFRLESSDNSDKILPRAAQIAGSIMVLYVGLTVACTVSYQLAGLSTFDALTHAMTTIATGGFSTRDASLGAFDNAAVEYIAVAFMITASLPFLVLVQVLQGRVVRLFTDVQVRWFFRAADRGAERWLPVARACDTRGGPAPGRCRLTRCRLCRCRLARCTLARCTLARCRLARGRFGGGRWRSQAPRRGTAGNRGGRRASSDGRPGQYAEANAAELTETAEANDGAPAAASASTKSAFRATLFNVVSIMTGTGYVTLATGGYDAWGGANSGFGAMLFLAIMFIGGCAGSTACGIKVFRFYVLFITLKERVLTFAYPSRIVVSEFNGRPMPESASAAVMNFLFLFLLTFALIATALSIVGLQPVSAISGAASALCNVGPAIGPDIGPAPDLCRAP